MLSGLPTNVFFLRVNMTRNVTITLCRPTYGTTRTKDRWPQHQVTQAALLFIKTTAELERASRTKLENKAPTKTVSMIRKYHNQKPQNSHNQWEQQQSFHHPHSVSVIPTLYTSY